MARAHSTRFAAVILVVFVAVTAWADQPPKLAGPDGGLPDRLVIQQRITYWLDALAGAEDIRKITEARRRLISDYLHFDDPQFRYDYASLAATSVLKMFGQLNDGELRQVRELNAAMAVARMDQVSVQPALEQMIIHRNPAVRLWGWRGFAAIRQLSLAQGEGPANALFEALRQRSKAEPSGLVCGVIFDMMALPPVAPETVPVDVWSAASKTFLQILSANWSRCTSHVSEGRLPWIDAAGRALPTLKLLARPHSDEPDAVKEPLQLIVNLMYAAFRAYDRSEPGDDVNSTTSALLLACESALRSFTGITDSAIKAALTHPRNTAEQKRDQAGLAVAAWLDLLKDYEVKKPDIKLVDNGDEASADAAPEPAPDDD